MFTIYDVAKRWNLSRRHVAKWIQSGRLVPDVGSGQTDWSVFRFSAATLNAFHKAHGFDAAIMPLFEEPVEGNPT